jgi:hypothetical protein
MHPSRPVTAPGGRSAVEPVAERTGQRERRAAGDRRRAGGRAAAPGPAADESETDDAPATPAVTGRLDVVA